jgi:amino acid adenylation domain-containing protein/non-ribosomal peptide synthase protein (TIGR01720 family)
VTDTREQQRKELLKYLLTQVQEERLDVDQAKAFLRVVGPESAAEADSGEPMAVVGIACRMPDAPDKERFWSNLASGHEAIGAFPPDRLADLRRVIPDHDPPSWGGYLDRIDQFDPEYFGITPRGAVELDPYHRQMMEVLVETFEDAGYARSDMEGTSTGVYVGNDHSHRLRVSYMQFLGMDDFSEFVGSWPGVLASRLSYHLNLCGPAAVTDTGCSSGLMALDAAIKAIRQGDCDGALVGGINLFLYPGKLGSDFDAGRYVRTFDAAANGTVWSEAVAAVYIKPLARATADGDHIYGLIVSNAANNDGRSNGITAPNPKAIQQVLTTAWKRAGIEPESLSYIEAHGPGTVLGDPVEVKGIKAAFGEFTDRKQFCALGSVKSSVGHTVGVAGLASLIKTMLSLERGALPPSLNFTVPNPHLDLIDSPVYVNDRLAEWKTGATPRRAGVSSLSVTGTNTHVVVEEAPAAPPRSPVAPAPHLYLISARSEALLARSAERQFEFLKDRPDYRLDDVCHTMRVGRDHQPVRAAILCEDRDGLLAGLERLLRPQEEHEEPFPSGRTVLLRQAPQSAPASPGDAATAPGGVGRSGLPERFLAWRDAVTDYLTGHGRPPAVAADGARRVPLPPQPFDHARYWSDYVAPAVSSTTRNSSADTARAEGPDDALTRWTASGGSPATARSIAAAVWMEVLGYPEIAGPENFFALGGDSVSSLRIIQLLNAELDLDIPPTVLLQEPVFEDFAAAVTEFGLDDELVRSRLGGPAARVEADDDLAEYELPLPASQRSLMARAVGLVDGSLAYNTTSLVISDRSVDAARLESAVRELVRRHANLRASFHIVDGEAVQRVHADVDVVVERYHLDAPGPGESHEDRSREQMVQFVRPFRFDEAPLFRIGHFAFSDGVTCVAMDFHHLIIDGTSMGTLTRDLAALIEGAVLPAQPRSYRSAILGLIEREKSAETQRARDYWRDQFADLGPTLDLTTDRQRSHATAGTGATLFTELDGDTLDALLRYARARNLTPFVVLLGVYYQLLSRLSGQRDIVIGTPIQARPDLSYTDVAGMFASMLPLRITADPAAEVGEFHSQLGSTVLAAFEHQSSPLELIAEDLDLPRQPGRNPLFDVCFAFQNTDRGLDDVGGQFLTFDNGGAKFDLTLDASVSGGRLLLHWEYSTELFREETVRLYVERYAKLLRSILAAADTDTVGALPLLPEPERALIEQGAVTAAPPAESVGVHRLFEQRAADGPDRTALITETGRVSYGELNTRANRLAHHLARHGAVPGAPVAILADRGADLVVAVLGVLKAGCHYVPLSVEFPDERLALMLRDSGARLIVATDGRTGQAGRFAGGAARVVDLSAGTGPAEEGTDPALPSSGDDPVYIMYTSGTTGAPKGSTIRHRSVLRVAHQPVFYPAGPDDVFLLMSDYSFDGSVYDMFAALTNGASLVVLDKQDVLDLDRLSSAIERHGVTSFFITATLFHALIDHAPERLRGIRRMIFGGEAASPSHVARAFQLLGPGRIANGYGPTESTVFAAVHVVDSCDEREAVPIGRPVNDTSLWVLDDDLRLQPIGVPGELCIGGTGLADGYLNQPELTAERFVESPDIPGERLYRTGDLVTLRSNGLYYYTGRVDEQVKLRGYRIETAEIVHVAVAEPDVRWAHAAVHQTGDGNPSLCLWVRYEDGAEPDDARLRAAMARRLPAYMVPTFVIRVEEVPFTGNGKLDTAALPAPVLTAAESASPPATDAERRIAAAWSRALGTEVADVDVNFFQLGGDSIKAIQITAALKSDGITLRATDLLDNQTVRMLATQVSAGQDAQEVYDQAPVSGPMLPSPIQQAFLSPADELAAGNRDKVFNQSLVITSDTSLPDGEVTAAVERLIRLHDALRIRLVDGELVLAGPDQERLLHAETAPAGLSGAALTEYLSTLQKRVDARTGPAVALATGLGERGEQCALAIHHLAVDVVSWGILLEDLLACLADAAVPLAPKTMALPEWTADLTAHARGGGFRGQLPYWTDLARRAGASGALFGGHPGHTAGADGQVSSSGVRRGDTVAEVLRFPAAEVTELLDAARTAYGSAPAQIVLAVVARALGEWRGRDRILVTMEGHGREQFAEERDLTRTVGWFTTTFPHLVRLEHAIGDTLHGIRRSFDRLPDRGFGYGPLCRLDTGLDAENAALLAGIRPEVGVNYLGEQGGRQQGIEVAHLPAEITVDEDYHMPHVLDVNAWLSKGDLLVEVRHPAAWRERGDARALADAVRESFHAIRDAVTTPDRPAFRTSSSVRPGLLDDIVRDITGEG